MNGSSEAHRHEVRLLTGEYTSTLDSNRRVHVPKKLRDQIDGSLYIVLGANGILSIYREMDFTRMLNALAGMNLAPDEVVSFERIYFSQADKIELDENGGLLLEKIVVDRANLGDHITLLGLMDHMELWNSQDWEQYISDHLTQYQEQIRRARQASFDNNADK